MKPIIKWQYSKLEDTLGLLEEHIADPDCPCSSEGEACPRKHLKRAEAYAAETIAILARSDGHGDEIEKLAEMAEEAKNFRLVEERKLCGEETGEDESVSIGWAGTWRKYFENLVVSSCDIAPPAPALVEEVAEMFRKKVEPRWCHPVKETEKELSKLSRTLGTAKKRIAVIQRSLEMPLNICRGQAEMFETPTGVLDPYGSRCRDHKTGQWVYSEDCGYEPAGITTTALGMDGLTRYEFEFKIVSLDKLIVSHDPFTFTPNPKYPAELQPRLRERAATKIQVEKIAANLEPDAVITDFHVIDRGTPIVGPDFVVEAGNGRVMGIIRAAAEHPDKYSNYKDRLRERTHDYGLSPQDVDSIENPVLIRVRISDVDRTTFAQEANQAATIAPSAIENARTDAQKITLGMLRELAVGENESLEDALRAPKNQAFAKRFLATLPENVQAALVDAQGYLNRDGVHRMAMGIFVSAFQGDAGLRLAEKAFESVDMDVRNTVNAIARSLGTMAQAEALTRTGERDTTLSIGDDLAQTINVYSAIKRNPALTVEKYLAQEQIFARELTPFQESILVVLDEYKRAPKKLAGIFTAYAEGVIAAPPPAQVALIPGAEITKEGLWESAVKAPEAQPVLMEVIRMFDTSCDRPSAKYQHLSMFFTESASEAALFASEPGDTERKIDTVLAKLESGIKEIYESSNFKDFIDTMSKFHNYSLGNIMLIALQRPAATRVSGYRTWQELGRNVKQGEHGIMILAPCFPPKPKKKEKEEEEEEEGIQPEESPIYFRVVHVFDVDQTYGKELPKVEVPVITGDETRHLYQKAQAYVAKLGIKLSSKPMPKLDPGLMGFWSKPQNMIWVRPDAPQDQRTKTLLHETAHAKCEMRGASEAEVMAESVAYTVANHFGFDTGVRSFPYVALWAKDIKVLKSNLETIRLVAKDMIQGLELVAGMSAGTMEVAEMFEKAGYDKAVYIKRLLAFELCTGTIAGKPDVLARAKFYAKKKIEELEEIDRHYRGGALDRDRELDAIALRALGRRVPSYLQEVARMFNKNISQEILEAPMKLLTQEIRKKLPALYSQENVADPMVQVKFFTPDSNWTWYATEYSPEEQMFFGWVVGFEKELGYFSLRELESARGPMGLAIERDKFFTPMPLSEVKKLHQHEHGELGEKIYNLEVLCFETRDRKPVQLPYGVMIGDKFYLLTKSSPNVEGCGTYRRVGKNDFIGRDEAEMSQIPLGAIGSAAITGIGIGAGFKFVDWVSSKFSKGKVGEEAADIIDRIAQRYQELEIIKAESGASEEDINYFNGQQSGLLWVGYRIDETRMIQAVAPLESEQEQEELEAVEKALENAEVVG